MSLRILYLGSMKSSATSNHRAQALKRLGNDVVSLDPYELLNFKRFPALLSQLHFRSGYKLMQPRVAKWLMFQLAGDNEKFDLVWVNGGELLGKNCLEILKALGCPIVLYNNDDPTGGRDGNRFDTLLSALPSYDFAAVLRMQNVDEYLERGVPNVMRVYMSYDEVVHKPFEYISDIPEKFRSEVAFIGTWMRNEHRDKFLLELIKNGISVSIWGARWKKSPLWKELKSYYKGPALSGREYVAAIQGAKICLGMLSKGNRDLHTRRSVEIPFIGGLFCAERTSEHEEMYKDNVEAVYWNDAKECAEVCKRLLADDVLRNSIRSAGATRVRKLHVGNEDIAAAILDKVRIVYSANETKNVD